jgi:hypothetical protein
MKYIETNARELESVNEIFVLISKELLEAKKEPLQL